MSDHSELRETFDHFDRDHNGTIDRAEFTQLLDALGADMSAEEAAIGFDIIDADGNGVIEYGEFYGWWSSR